MKTFQTFWTLSNSISIELAVMGSRALTDDKATINYEGGQIKTQNVDMLILLAPANLTSAA